MSRYYNNNNKSNDNNNKYYTSILGWTHYARKFDHDAYCLAHALILPSHV